MRTWKKLACGCLSAAMVLTLLSGSVFWVAAEETIDDHMVVHWDFEGETTSDKLSDKATAGTAQDTLTVNATDKTVLENGYAYLKEGGHNLALYAEPSVDANQKGEQTIFMRAFLENYTLDEYNHEGVNGEKGQQVLFNQRDSGLFMQVVRWNYDNVADWGVDTKVGEGTNGGWSTGRGDEDFWNGMYGKWVDLAIVVDDSGENGNLKAKFYVNMSGDAADAAADFKLFHEFDTGVKSFNNSAVTRLGGYVGEGDWAYGMGHTKFDDVRIYDMALTTEQLVSVSQAAVKKNDTDDEPADDVVLDDHMVVHWDFEGETTSDKLSDKATAGTAQDTLTVNATDKTVLENGYAYLKEGGHNLALYAEPSVDANQKGEQTIFMRAFLENYTLDEYNHEGVNGEKGQQVLFNQRDSGLFMQVVRWNYDNVADWGVDTKVGEGTNGGWSTGRGDEDFWNGMYGKWVDLAIVVDDSGENGNLKAKFYVNMSGDAADAAADFKLFHEFDTGVKSFNNSAVTRLGGYVGEGDWAYGMGHTKFDDVRIYDMALTTEQLVSVSQAAVAKDKTDDSNDTVPSPGTGEPMTAMAAVVLLCVAGVAVPAFGKKHKR